MLNSEPFVLESVADDCDFVASQYQALSEVEYVGFNTSCFGRTKITRNQNAKLSCAFFSVTANQLLFTDATEELGEPILTLIDQVSLLFLPYLS